MRYQYGRQTSCAVCEMDIEYHGPEHGWIDRGANTYCDESGAHPIDRETGEYGKYPHRKHRPVTA